MKLVDEFDRIAFDRSLNAKIRLQGINFRLWTAAGGARPSPSVRSGDRLAKASSSSCRLAADSDVTGHTNGH